MPPTGSREPALAADHLGPPAPRGRRAQHRRHVPRAWLVTTIYSLMHAAAQEVDAGRLSPADAGVVLETTLLSAIERPAAGNMRR